MNDRAVSEERKSDELKEEGTKEESTERENVWKLRFYEYISARQQPIMRQQIMCNGL